MATHHVEDATAGGQHHHEQPTASLSKQFSQQVDDVINDLKTNRQDNSSGPAAEKASHQHMEPEFTTNAVKATSTATADRLRRRQRKSLARDGQETVGASKKWRALMIANYKHSESLCNVLSILYAIFMMVLGVVFPLTEMFGRDAGLRVGSFEGFYVYMFMVSIAFLLYIQFFIVQKHEETLYRKLRRKISQLWACCKGCFHPKSSNADSYDSESAAVTLKLHRASSGTRQMSSFNSHAATGSFYLRLGAVAFGVGGMILDGLQFGLFIEAQTYEGCTVDTAEMLRPIAQLVFTFLQMYFIFRDSKLYIHAHRIAGRFGLMHMVATNMCVWFRVCTMETIHELHHLMSHGGDHGHGGGGHGDSGHHGNHTVADVQHHAALDHHVVDEHRHRREAAHFDDHHGGVLSGTALNATLTSALHDLSSVVHDNVTSLINAVAHGAHDVLSGVVNGHHADSHNSHAVGLDSHGTMVDALNGHSTGDGGGHGSGGLCEGLSETLTEAVNSMTPFLYACTVEYSLIGAGVMYLIWLNVSRPISADSHHQPDHHHHHLLEPETDGHHHRQDHGHDGKVHDLVGAHHHNDENDHSPGHEVKPVQKVSFNCSKASVGLFFGIFVLISTIICIIVFFAMLDRDNGSAALTTSYPVMYIIEIILYALSMAAIVGAAHGLRHLTFHKELHCELDEILLLVALVGVYTFCMFSILCGTHQPDSPLAALVTVTSFMILLQSTMQTLFILNGLRRSAGKAEHVTKMPGRQYLTFLIVNNISLWAVNSFLVLRSDSNPVAVEFYGQLPWSLVTHASMPLAIFYRFHSTVCLVDIWKDAYKIKEHHH